MDKTSLPTPFYRGPNEGLSVMNLASLPFSAHRVALYLDHKICTEHPNIRALKLGDWFCTSQTAPPCGLKGGGGGLQ